MRTAQEYQAIADGVAPLATVRVLSRAEANADGTEIVQEHYVQIKIGKCKIQIDEHEGKHGVRVLRDDAVIDALVIKAVGQAALEESRPRYTEKQLEKQRAKTLAARVVPVVEESPSDRYARKHGEYEFTGDLSAEIAKIDAAVIAGAISPDDGIAKADEITGWAQRCAARREQP